MYTLPDGYLATTGQEILASQHNPPLEDLGVAITGSLPRNGTSGMLANLPMGGFKATNMADGVAASDSATVGQVTALISTSTAGAPTKSTPVDADSLMLIDSAAGNALKRVTWANVKAFFQPVNSVLTALSSIGAAVAGDFIYGSAAGVWSRLAKGTASQQLRMNAGATAPEWFTPSTAGIAKAWVNFNGTGTVAIRSSFNVSSITDNGGSGDYTINFTTNMTDANYAVMICPSMSSNTTVTGQVITQAVGSCRFTVTREGVGYLDMAIVSVVIFGD